MKIFRAIILVALASSGKSNLSQTIPDVTVTGPALAANVHGGYSSVSTPSSPTVVNAPVVGNGDMALMIGGPSTSLSFCAGKSDFWGVQHGVIMPVGSLVLSASALSGSSYLLVQNVGAATVTGSFTSGSSGLGLNTWISTSQNTAFIQLTNTGSQPLPFSSKLLDGFWFDRDERRCGSRRHHERQRLFPARPVKYASAEFGVRSAERCRSPREINQAENLWRAAGAISRGSPRGVGASVRMRA